MAIVNIAIDEYPKLKSSTIEFNLPQPSYTVNTLTHIQEKHPAHTFSLIMGEDNLKGFHKWKNYETILENHHIYVYPRVATGIAIHELIDHHHIHKVDAPIVEISATQIRKGIQEKFNVRPMLPSKVWEYMDEMNFYK